MAQPFVSSQIYSSHSSDKLIRSTYVAKMVRSTTMGPKCPYTVPNCLRAICSCASFLHPAQCLPIIHHPQSFHFAGSPPLRFFVTRISPYYYYLEGWDHCQHKAKSTLPFLHWALHNEINVWIWALGYWGLKRKRAERIAWVKACLHYRWRERPCEQGNISSLFCLHAIYTLYFLEPASDIIVTSSATLTWSLSLWLSQLVPMYSVYGVPASWENQIFLANIV